MFDKTEKKVLNWMLETHYLPVVRNAIFLKIENDLKELKDMKEQAKFKKELLHRFDFKHAVPEEMTNVIKIILEKYNLGIDSKEKTYFFDELCVLYKLIAKHARELIEAEQYDTIKNLCAGATLN